MSDFLHLCKDIIYSYWSHWISLIDVMVTPVLRFKALTCLYVEYDSSQSACHFPTYYWDKYFIIYKSSILCFFLSFAFYNFINLTYKPFVVVFLLKEHHVSPSKFSICIETSISRNIWVITLKKKMIISELKYR